MWHCFASDTCSFTALITATHVTAAALQNGMQLSFKICIRSYKAAISCSWKCCHLFDASFKLLGMYKSTKLKEDPVVRKTADVLESIQNCMINM